MTFHFRHFGKSAGNFGGSAVRRPVGHDLAVAMSKLVALLPNYMQIVQNWLEKGVDTLVSIDECLDTSWHWNGDVNHQHNMNCCPKLPNPPNCPPPPRTPPLPTAVTGRRKPPTFRNKPHTLHTTCLALQPSSRDHNIPPSCRSRDHIVPPSRSRPTGHVTANLDDHRNHVTTEE